MIVVTFITDSKTFDEYLDEYYGLECEDMIGEMKCRFPYRDVPANDYGLSVAEVRLSLNTHLTCCLSIRSL